MKTVDKCNICSNRKKKFESLNREAKGDLFYRESIRDKYTKNIDKGMCQNSRCKSSKEDEQVLRDFAGKYAWTPEPLKKSFSGRWANHYHQCTYCNTRFPSRKTHAFEGDYIEPELELQTPYAYVELNGENIPYNNTYLDNPLAKRKDLEVEAYE